MGKLRGGTTIGGYLAGHYNNFKDFLANQTSATFTGDATGTGNFDATTGDLGVVMTVVDNSHNHTSTNISDATSLNTTSKIVERDASGNIASSNFGLIIPTSRAVPTVVNNYINVGTASVTNGTFNLEVNVTVDVSGFSIAKKYNILASYDQTAGAWWIANPSENTGVNATQDFDLDINVSLATLVLRIRRSAGATAGTAVVTIRNLGVSTTSFAESSTTGTTTVPLYIFDSKSLSGFILIDENLANTGYRLLVESGQLKLQIVNIPNNMFDASNFLIPDTVLTGTNYTLVVNSGVLSLREA